MDSIFVERAQMPESATYRHLVKPEDTLLLVVNLQEGLIASMERKHRETFLRNSRVLIRTAQSLSIPIIASEQMPERFGHTLSEIDAMLGDSRRISKKSFSCWREGEMRAAIKQEDRRTVIVLGIEAHVCVLLTVMDLLNTGHHAVVATDAVCSRRACHREMAVQAMGHAGAVIYPTETIAFMLMDKASAPFFDESLALLGWDSPKPYRVKMKGE